MYYGFKCFFLNWNISKVGSGKAGDNPGKAADAPNKDAAVDPRKCADDQNYAAIKSGKVVDDRLLRRPIFLGGGTNYLHLPGVMP